MSQTCLPSDLLWSAQLFTASPLYIWCSFSTFPHSGAPCPLWFGFLAWPLLPPLQDKHLSDIKNQLGVSLIPKGEILVWECLRKISPISARRWCRGHIVKLGSGFLFPFLILTNFVLGFTGIIGRLMTYCTTNQEQNKYAFLCFSDYELKMLA